ncbi:MAG: hypothetical protein ACI8XO_004619 [Verrucomicrobiales bacterium]|jgi:hypothetical protein
MGMGAQFTFGTKALALWSFGLAIVCGEFSYGCRSTGN